MCLAWEAAAVVVEAGSSCTEMMAAAGGVTLRTISRRCQALAWEETIRKPNGSGELGVGPSLLSCLHGCPFPGLAIPVARRPLKDAVLWP